MSRWKAAAIHLAISVVVVGGIVGGLLLLWYPPPMFSAFRADRLIFIAAAVDVVVGPLLTAMVFRSGKRGLRFDLTVIALLQAVALGYGLWVMWQSRPVFMVAAVDRFELVFANEIEPADLAEGPEERFRSLPWNGARLVGAQVPFGSRAKLEAALAGIAGKDIHLTPRTYVDYSIVAPSLLKRSEPLAALRKLGPGAAERVDDFLARGEHSENWLRYVPVVSTRGRASMVIDGSLGTPLGMIDLDPWAELE
jgi:hypothetical protein